MFGVGGGLKTTNNKKLENRGDHEKATASDLGVACPNETFTQATSHVTKESPLTDTRFNSSKPTMNIRPSFYFEPNGVPVFQPTMDEFRDFYRFVLSIESYGMEAGLVKIIPPKEWFEDFELNFKVLKDFKIKPIKQKFNCGAGLPLGAYRQVNMGSAKEYSVQEWADLSKDEYAAPCLTRNGTEVRSTAESDCNQSVPKEWIGSFVTEFSTKNSPAYYSALEKHYWNNLTFSSALYGADLMGSLFVDKKENSWNISNLESILSKIGAKIPGVTTPYLYFGTYKSSFAWHVEDMDLSSINYIHFGAPKQWYVVSPKFKEPFEKLAKCN